MLFKSLLFVCQECVADALPKPTYQWFKNDQPLAADTAGILLKTTESLSQLAFSSPGQDHAGWQGASVADPGSGAFLTPWIWDQGWVKNQDPDFGSGMNIPDHISESLETIFGVKILNILRCVGIWIRNPESFGLWNRDEKIWIWDPG